MRRQFAGAVAAAVLAAPPALAQTDTRYGAWTYSVSESGSRLAFARGDELMLFVTCPRGLPALSLHMLDGIFRDGDVALRWDDREVERYTFQDNDDHLSASAWPADVDYHPEAGSVVVKAVVYSQLRVQAERWPGTQVTDRISLNGSGRAIRALGCID